MTAPLPKPKILVVEDQPDVLATMIYLLKRAGCETTGAKTGRGSPAPGAGGEV